MKISKHYMKINAKVAGVGFLYYNKSLIYLHAPSLELVGNCFLRWNESLIKLYVPMLKNKGIGFLHYNKNKGIHR